METESSPRPVAAPRFPRVEVKGLLRLAEDPEAVEWQPFKDGVDIHRIYGDGLQGPTAALLRFREASRIPLHEHPGIEHIFVLAGSQRDQNGPIAAGTLVVNPTGSRHAVEGEAGCIVLAIYQESVRFLEGE